MKKIILSLSGAFTVVLILLFSSFAVSAYVHYEDIGFDSCRIEYTADFENGTATVTGCSPDYYSGKIVIPEYIPYYDDDYDYDYDYDDDWYYDDYYDCDGTIYLKVISVDCRIDIAYLEYIQIPDSVQYIREDTFYMSDEPEYESFVISCVQGSYADTYATGKGFATEYVKDIASLDISLSAAEFTYTSERITPDVTIKDGDVTLVKGKNYSLYYENNRNAGTASVFITASGNYCGGTKLDFTIKPVPANWVSISSVDDYEYYGESIEPWIELYYNDNELRHERDYTYTYKNNYYPGTASIDIVFKGNYTGTRTVNFRIILPSVTDFTANTYSSEEISLDWYSWSTEADTFYIYRYSSSKGKYVYIGQTENSYYNDKKLKQCTLYKYQILPVVFNDKKEPIYGEAAYVECQTLLSAPKIELTSLKSSIKVSYTENSYADGYVIYRYNAEDYDPKAIKTVKGNKAGTYADKKIDTDTVYGYYAVAFKNVNGKPVYGEQSNYCYSDDPAAVLKGATLKSHNSFKVYNTQGKKTTEYTYTLSEKDIKTLKKFAKKHFKKNMTQEDKLLYTLEWIHYNNTYALGDNWNKISGKSWVDAIYNYKLGQCAQYNGALAAMMVYLGYDAYVIKGYRGSSYTGNNIQHFWCEVKIQGRRYVMETGNFKRNGSWKFFLTPYNFAGGYIINQQPAHLAVSKPKVDKVSLSATKFVYNGKTKKPIVTAKDTHGNTLTEGKDYTVTYSKGRKKVGKYKVTVKFKGKYSGSKKLTFSIIPKAPTLSKLKSGSKKITVKWKKQTTETTGYQLQYSTSSKMKKAKTVTVNKNTSTTKTVKDLKKGKNYYVRIRTYKTVSGKNIYSSWSQVKKVKVK